MAQKIKLGLHDVNPITGVVIEERKLPHQKGLAPASIVLLRKRVGKEMLYSTALRVHTEHGEKLTGEQPAENYAVAKRAFRNR